MKNNSLRKALKIPTIRGNQRLTPRPLSKANYQPQFLTLQNHFILTIITFLILFITFSNADNKTTKKNVVLKTKDDVTIKGTIGLPDSVDGKLPAVILIHQGGSDRTEWGGFFDKLLAENYVVFAYDVRGHGKSDKVEDIYPLFNNPNLAPKDLIASIYYLTTLPQVDSTRIAVVGSSIGSNLACVAVSALGVKTAVAMSGKTSAVMNLLGNHPLKLKSVFHISSKGDQGGKRAIWAKELYEKTAEPRKLAIVEGSSAHGVGIFKDDSSLENEILNWLKETL